jgi:nucleosome binding factor SPN SPT16 subunit
VFVFKDYSKAPQRISNIPSEYLESLKDWLDDINVLFSESPNPLKWVNVMKEINKDLEAFVENGGWNFLHDDSDSEAGVGDSQAILDTDSDVQDEDFGEAEDSDGGSEEFSDDEDSSDYEESLESEDEGLSWDELEREAEASDVKRKIRRNEKAPKP